MGGRSSSSKYGSRRSSKICACLDCSQRAQKLISLFLPFCCSREGTTHVSICKLRRIEEGIRESFLLHLSSSGSSSASGLPSTNSKSLHEEVKQQEEKDAAVLGFWLGFGCGRPGGGEVRTCAPGEEEGQQEQEEEQECKESFGEEAWLFLLCRRASDLCGREQRICNWTGVHRECTQRDNNLVRIIVGIRLLLLLLLLQL